jgi:hypothetical protein
MPHHHLDETGNNISTLDFAFDEDKAAEGAKEEVEVHPTVRLRELCPASPSYELRPARRTSSAPLCSSRTSSTPPRGRASFNSPRHVGVPSVRLSRANWPSDAWVPLSLSTNIDLGALFRCCCWSK